MLTRQHFNAFAAAIREVRERAFDDGGDRNVALIVMDGLVIPGLAHELSLTNPRFDEARFIRACSCPDGV